MAVMENIREMNFSDFSAVLVTTPQVGIVLNIFFPQERFKIA